MKYKRYLLSLILCVGLCAPAGAGELPAAVVKQTPVAIEKVGEGTYRKIGVKVYQASLWAPGAQWDPAEPYALQLVYSRGLSKDTVVQTVVDNIQEQNVADEETMSRWTAQMTKLLPGVRKGDRLVGLSIPGKDSQLFLNGKRIARITEKALSDAFFAIWLGETADKGLRGKLLGG